MNKMRENTDLLAEIETETDERKLRAMAWQCHGSIHSRQMTPADYADCMVALTRKLGYPPFEKNLIEE